MKKGIYTALVASWVFITSGANAEFQCPTAEAFKSGLKCEKAYGRDVCTVFLGKNRWGNALLVNVCK